MKISPPMLRALSQRGYKVVDIRKTAVGYVYSNVRPATALYEDDDDEKVIFEAGRRQRHEGLKQTYVRRTQITNTATGRQSYHVLGKIEAASGIKLFAGWSGDFSKLCEDVGMSEDEVAGLWNESVDNLRSMPDIVITQ